jgi:hypothetical protein
MIDEDFPFKVVRTNGHDEVLSRSMNLLIGRAAFETAKRLYPRDQLEYRKGAQVLDRMALKTNCRLSEHAFFQIVADTP